MKLLTRLILTIGALVVTIGAVLVALALVLNTTVSHFNTLLTHEKALASDSMDAYLGLLQARRAEKEALRRFAWVFGSPRLSGIPRTEQEARR